MPVLTPTQFKKELQELVESKWRASRLRVGNRKRYDALCKKLKGKPIWTSIPRKKASEQEVEDWAMLLPLPYDVPTYEAAYGQTIRAAYRHQKRVEPPYLYHHKMGIPIPPVKLEFPQIFNDLRKLKAQLKTIDPLDCKVLLALHGEIHMSFSPLAERGSVLEKVSEAFNKINDLYVYTKTVLPKNPIGLLRKCFKVYEDHIYNDFSLEDIATTERKRKWREEKKRESQSAANRKIKNYFRIAKELVEGTLK